MVLSNSREERGKKRKEKLLREHGYLELLGTEPPTADQTPPPVPHHAHPNLFYNG